jgi:hypothetical protein
MSDLNDRLDVAFDQSIHGRELHRRLESERQERLLLTRECADLRNQLADEREAHEQTREVAELYELWTSLLFLLFLAAILGKGIMI